jgi:hypothetical protein
MGSPESISIKPKLKIIQNSPTPVVVMDRAPGVNVITLLSSKLLFDTGKVFQVGLMLESKVRSILKVLYPVELIR